jgi:hypothetical protein
MCTNGACSGVAGSAACCTNSCTLGLTQPQCLSSTSLQACTLGSNGCTSVTASTCSTGLVCERYGPSACLDPSWAEWPIPNDQPDVAAGAPNLESYVDNGDGTVTDNVTDLVWQKTASIAEFVTWSGAVAYCPTLTLGGHSDWRLPSVTELLSIVDYSRTNPAANTAYFSGLTGSFWSSTPQPGGSGNAWAVSFLAGDASPNAMGGSQYVLCVR